MLNPLSLTEQALRDTLITRAQDGALDDLSRLFGIPRVRIVEPDFWRRALRAGVYGPRGVLHTTHNVLEAMFDQWAERCYSYQVEIDPGSNLLTRVEGPPGFYPIHVNRLVRVSTAAGTGIYWSLGVVGDKLMLSRNPGPYWSGFDSTSVDPFDGIVKVLPFLYAEPEIVAPCTVLVYLDGDIWYTPPSYMQPDGDDRPVGEPFGCILIDPADGDPATPSRGDQINGPFPLYLPGDEVGGALRVTMDALLAAGIQITFKLTQFDRAAGAFNVFQYNEGLGLPPLYDWRTHFTVSFPSLPGSLQSP